MAVMLLRLAIAIGAGCLVSVLVYGCWLWWQRRKLKAILALAIHQAKLLSSGRNETGFDPDEAEATFYRLCTDLCSRRKLSTRVVPTDQDERERLKGWLIRTAGTCHAVDHTATWEEP